ncbi:methyltransferase small [Pyrolobus fumarii 1A]|uniref:Methyltransferase small n=1 Tax=Pyrolobus fumarii (strain DSM 11204 / 1A) TaxID=694429 RepID=G0ECH6_PYRF1|nr:methyltransferase small [Pyrolobus fumarii 1A]
MSHYYRPGRRRYRGVWVVADTLRGVTVEFRVSGDVFSADEIDEGTRLLVENARVPEEGTVLDLGCGYGVIGITLAKAYPRLRVYMVDVNPRAVELARVNAKHNGVADRVVVLHGDLYEPVKGHRFDAIITNPPLAAGMDVVERIVREAPEHLNQGGSLQMVLKKGADRIARVMDEVFGSHEVLLRKKGYTILMAVKR